MKKKSDKGQMGELVNQHKRMAMGQSIPNGKVPGKKGKKGK